MKVAFTLRDGFVGAKLGYGPEGQDYDFTRAVASAKDGVVVLDDTNEDERYKIDALRSLARSNGAVEEVEVPKTRGGSRDDN